MLTSSLSFSTPGWYSSRWPTIRMRSLAREASTTASASSAERPIGFSTKQCLPPASTRVASSAWVGTGVATTTASSESSESRSSSEVVVRAEGKAAPQRSSASSEASQSQVSSASGSLSKLRARLGPQ